MDRNKDKDKSSGGGFLAGLFCVAAGVAVGLGAKYLFDELSKKEEIEEKVTSKADDEEIEPPQKVATTVTAPLTSQGEVQYESFICPISQGIMVDPVITPHGISYDRSSIKAWLKKNKTCPITKKPLDESMLVTNYALKNAISDYLKKNNK